MTDRNDTIRPRARRQVAGETAVELSATASSGARVLVRIPMVTSGVTPARQLEKAASTDSGEERLGTTAATSLPSAGTTAAPLPAIRIDAAHDEISGPHSAAPEWLDRRAGRFARIVQGRSLVAVALVVGIAIVVAVQIRSAGPTAATKEEVSATRSERKQHRAARGGAKVEGSSESGVRAGVESSTAVSSFGVPNTAVSNSPAAIGQPSPGTGASAAANDPAQEGGSDIFRLYDSPGAVPSSEAGAGRDARAGLRMALRDVPAEGTSAETAPGTAASRARLGGMLGKLPVLNSQ